ncbi:MAG TPA: hypothetical protein V6D29_16010 [Leptolyngbyaceae cyanobacterium]
MRQIPRRFISLSLTAVFSFLLPLLLIGSIFLSLFGLTTLSWLMPLSQQGLQQFIHVLTTLGSGDPWQGALVVGLTSSTVGVLFDTFASYRFEEFGHH